MHGARGKDSALLCMNGGTVAMAWAGGRTRVTNAPL